MKNYLDKMTDRDKNYVLIKGHDDDQYLSFILMPQSLYDKLADILIVEETDYFWGLQYSTLDESEYAITIKKLFQPFGRKVNIRQNNYWFFIIGSIPSVLIPYLKEIK